MNISKAFTIIASLMICIQGGLCFAEQTEAVEMNFYGKLIDDYDDPIPSASIHVQVRGTAVEQSVKKVVAKTDALGSFTLSETGRSIKIMSIKKAGCKFDLSEKPQLKYSYVQKGKKEPFTPDAENPVTFSMSSKGNMGALVNIEVPDWLNSSGVQFLYLWQSGM